MTVNPSLPPLPDPASLGHRKEPAALAHIEKTLTDSYRKEIDQEENIWRSLPFFAATLALQLAALFQVIDRVPSGRSWLALLSAALVVASALCSLGALGVLAWSIYPAKFRYLAKDSVLLDYAMGLIADERHPDNLAQTTPMVALDTLKLTLAKQYALATDHNRRINKRRELRRSIAGLLTLFSIVSTLVVVSVTFVTYIARHDEKGVSDGRSTRPTTSPTVDARPASTPHAPAAPSAADAGSH